MSHDENYTCTLDAHSLQKAKRELNEDPKERVGALGALRDWVMQQKWLTSPTGMSLCAFIQWLYDSDGVSLLNMLVYPLNIVCVFNWCGMNPRHMHTDNQWINMYFYHKACTTFLLTENDLIRKLWLANLIFYCSSETMHLCLYRNTLCSIYLRICSMLHASLITAHVLFSSIYDL